MSLTRRALVRSSAALGLAACSGPGGSHVPAPVAPASLDAFARRLRDLSRRSGLKVARIETFHRDANVALVRVAADDGSEGWGQVAPYDADIAATVLHRKIAPAALGADPYDIDAISDRAVESN